MNTGIFGEGFPYSNYHDLNTDWIVKIAKDFLDQYTHIQDIIEQGKTDIENLTDSGLTQLQDKADALEALLQEWYDTHSSDIANQLADALADLNSWYTTHQNYLDATLTTKIAAFNSAADAKAAETIASIPADFTQLSTDVAEIADSFYNHKEINFGHGKNYFNYNTIRKGYTLKSDGTQEIVATGYTSDFIKVAPSTTYNKRYVFNSAAIADVVFYDINREFISAFYQSGTTKYFTTPATCEYIKICGYTADAVSECIELGSEFAGHAFYYEYLLSGSGTTESAFILARNQIVYDSVNKQLKVLFGNNESISVVIPGLLRKSISTPISVTGSGIYLYYDSSDNSFYLTNDDRVGSSLKDQYRIGCISWFALPKFIQGNLNNAFIVSTLPVLTYNFTDSKLEVNIPSSCYLWQNGYYKQLTQESYDLTLLPNNINCIFFNLATSKFVVANAFNEYQNNPEMVNIGFIFRSIIQLTVKYKVKAGEYALNGKTAITYGDSLTWYDGNDFTWGVHQGEECKGFQTYLYQLLGMNVTNKGESGSTTPDIATTILQDGTALALTDYVFIMPSCDNDDRLGVLPGTVMPIGSTYVNSTTAGSLQTAIDFIYSQNPDCKIIMLTQPKGYTYRNGHPEEVDDVYPTIVRNIAKLYSLPCIDLWNESGINQLTRNVYYADPSFESGNTLYMYHPNNDGWEVLSKIICEEMKKY